MNTLRVLFSFAGAVVVLSAFSACFAAQGAEDRVSPALKSALADSVGHPPVSAIVYLLPQADIAELDRVLTEHRVTRASRHHAVIEELRRMAAATQPAVKAHLSRLKSEGEIAGFTAYWIINAFCIKATRAAIMEVAARPDVQWVDASVRPVLIEPVRSRSRSLDENHGVPTGVRAIGARRVWYELGITGAGRLVGTIDTGVDGAHPALAARWRGLYAPVRECWLDVVGNSQFPVDNADPGHGTHVMGTLCGNSTTSNDSVGVAPGARWIACNAINQGGGEGFNNDILDAFQWMADPDTNSQTLEDVPDVVQNSWGVDARFAGYDDCFPLWNQAIVNCEAAGVVVIFSAGNEGPQERTVRSPATIELDSVTFFAVGAVDADGDTIPPYEIATFSSRGPSDCPPFTATKPEVCAPGVDVYSSLPNGDYGRLSGTSMAGPHVSGIVALMREANPNAEVREIKSVLMRSAVDAGTPGEDNDYGFGFVDAFEAVVQISANRALIEGEVRDAVTSEPITQALVRASERFQTRTNNQGHYRLSVIGDTTWMLQVSAYGYFGHSESVPIAVGDTLTRNVSLTSLPSGTIVGLVTAGSSVPVQGATVSFPGTPIPSRESAADGTFCVRVPGDSLYTVEASYDDVQRDTTFLVGVGDTVNVTLHLVSVRSEQEGPDAYGYRAYDRLDYGIPPIYDWVEIAPARGGDATVLTLEGRDSSGYVAMPFPFIYYGVEFDSITINENGWIAAGISHDHSFFNFRIPALSGPSAMLALWWDNLQCTADSTQICYGYDTLHCRMIVEYYDARFLPGTGSHLTCQLQIYDREAWPTPSADCELLFLYERIDIPNSSTVGIENPAETDGIQLLYNGTRGPRTWSIGAGSVVLFSTRTLERRTGTLAGSIVGHPPLQDYGQAVISAGCRRTHAGASGDFSLAQVFAGRHTARLELTGYEQAVSEIEIGPDSVTQLVFNVWRLDPPRDLQGEMVDGEVRLIWLPPESIGRRLDEFQQYRVFRDDMLIASVETESYGEPLPGSGVYDYYVRAQYEGGISDSSNHARVDASKIKDLEPETLPRTFALGPIHPNPFNSVTQFVLSVPVSCPVRVAVFDVLGRSVAVLVDQPVRAGWHTFRWDASDRPTGIYFLHAQAKEFRATKKVLLLR